MRLKTVGLLVISNAFMTVACEALPPKSTNGDYEFRVFSCEFVDRSDNKYDPRTHTNLELDDIFPWHVGY